MIDDGVVAGDYGAAMGGYVVVLGGYGVVMGGSWLVISFSQLVMSGYGWLRVVIAWLLGYWVVLIDGGGVTGGRGC